jgi:hypothetical protein
VTYVVTWIPVAEQELAAAWLASADRNAVTAAAHRLDQRLRIDPLHMGKARKSSVQRVALDVPLGVEFEVIEDDKKVRVLGVWITD